MAYYGDEDSIPQEPLGSNNYASNNLEEFNANNSFLSLFVSKEFLENYLDYNYWIILGTEYSKSLLTYFVYLAILIFGIILVRTYFAKKRKTEISEETKKKLYEQ